MRVYNMAERDRGYLSLQGRCDEEDLTIVASHADFVRIAIMEECGSRNVRVLVAEDVGKVEVSYTSAGQGPNRLDSLTILGSAGTTLNVTHDTYAFKAAGFSETNVVVLPSSVVLDTSTVIGRKATIVANDVNISSTEGWYGSGESLLVPLTGDTVNLTCAERHIEHGNAHHGLHVVSEANINLLGILQVSNIFIDCKDLSLNFTPKEKSEKLVAHVSRLLLGARMVCPAIGSSSPREFRLVNGSAMSRGVGFTDDVCAEYIGESGEKGVYLVEDLASETTKSLLFSSSRLSADTTGPGAITLNELEGAIALMPKDDEGLPLEWSQQCMSILW